MNIDDFEQRLSDNWKAQLRAIGENQAIIRELFTGMRTDWAQLRDEMAELHETITQLQAMVMEQGAAIRALRDDDGKGQP